MKTRWKACLVLSGVAGCYASTALAAESCITDGSAVRVAAVKSDVSAPVTLVVPQPVASSPMSAPLEARTKVATASSGTAFSSHAAGGVIIVR